MKYFAFDEDVNPQWYTYIQAFIIMFIIMPAAGVAIAIPVSFIGDTFHRSIAESYYVNQ